MPRLATYWGGTHGRYVEPFAGSAALFFYIEPRVALLGDLNRELVSAYQVIRDRPHSVAKILSHMVPDEDVYYMLRAQDPDDLDLDNRAARFVYLNRYCFNGLYRTNEDGKFNVPWGGSRCGRLPNPETLEVASRVLRRATVLCSDFEELVRNFLKAGDFVYLDPPYAVRNRRMFRQYGKDTFGLSDLERLFYLLRTIHENGAHFLLSYAWSPEAKELLKGWDSVEVRTQRNIAGFSGKRRSATEVLISNLPCPWRE